MKVLQIALMIAGIAVLLIVTVMSGNGGSEQGWPLNEQGEPVDGGNWQGEGQLDIPPEGIYAEWYNETKDDDAWVVESGDDVLRSFSAFHLRQDITIQDGGILRLDSVDLRMNSTGGIRGVNIRDGGNLYLTNSSYFGGHILVEPGGSLYILPGNGSSWLELSSNEDPGITVSEGSTVQILDSFISGSTTLIDLRDEDAEIHGNTFSTSGKGEACIHLQASTEVRGNHFMESSNGGSYAIVADESVGSLIHDNVFDGFRSGPVMGEAILSHGPLEIFNNTFKGMTADDQNAPYIINFVGVEPNDHEGEKIWDSNRFWGKTGRSGDERVNIFRQVWKVDVSVTNDLSGNPMEGVDVVLRDNRDFLIESTTDHNGSVTVDAPEFLTYSTDDGKDDPYRSRLILELNNYDIEVSKDDSHAMLEDETIDRNRQFDLTLDNIEYDFGVSGIEIQGHVIGGGTISLDAAVFNLGYNRSSTVTVGFSMTVSEVGEIALGDVPVLVNRPSIHVFLEDVLLDDTYAGHEIVFTAGLSFPLDANTSNDESISESIHIGERPSITIITPEHGAILSDTILFSGTATDDGGVDRVNIRVPGFLAWTRAGGTENWMYELNTQYLDMPNGEHSIEVRCLDNNGYYSVIETVVITVMNTPDVHIQSPGDGSILDGDLVHIMLGSTQVQDAQITRVTVSIDGGQEMDAKKVVGDWSQWRFDLRTDDVDILNTLSDGEHTFTASVYDDDGLNSSVANKYIIHSMDPLTDPEVTVTSPIENPYTMTGDLWIGGTASDDYRITNVQFRINEGEWTEANEILDADTPLASWRVRIRASDNDLREGMNDIHVRAFDDDTNTSHTIRVVSRGRELDISIETITLLDEDGNYLSKNDLVVGRRVTFLVIIDISTTDLLPSLEIALAIGDHDVARMTDLSVWDDHEFQVSIILSDVLVGDDNFTIVIDPTNVYDEINEGNNQMEEDLPGPIIPHKPKPRDPPIDLEDPMTTGLLVALLCGIAISVGVSVRRRSR